MNPDLVLTLARSRAGANTLSQPAGAECDEDHNFSAFAAVVESAAYAF
jgi:hypothetical protein